MSGRIYYIMGKSATGKDTVFQELQKEALNGRRLSTVTMYTTRPMRDGEENGREYYFVGEEELALLRGRNKVIECRTYQTVHGPWSYFTADDGQINLEKDSYLMIGTLESYRSMREYYGPDAMVPLYLYVEDGERLMRALLREQKQAHPRYAELCRRFLADEEDFSEEKLMACGIGEEYRCVNRSLEETLAWCRERMRYGS